jgi:hypothetical protein
VSAKAFIATEPSSVPRIAGFAMLWQKMRVVAARYEKLAQRVEQRSRDADKACAAVLSRSCRNGVNDIPSDETRAASHGRRPPLSQLAATDSDNACSTASST